MKYLAPNHYGRVADGSLATTKMSIYTNSIFCIKYSNNNYWNFIKISQINRSVLVVSPSLPEFSYKWRFYDITIGKSIVV